MTCWDIKKLRDYNVCSDDVSPHYSKKTLIETLTTNPKHLKIHITKQQYKKDKINKKKNLFRNHSINNLVKTKFFSVQKSKLTLLCKKIS